MVSKIRPVDHRVVFLATILLQIDTDIVETRLLSFPDECHEYNECVASDLDEELMLQDHKEKMERRERKEDLR